MKSLYFLLTPMLLRVPILLVCLAVEATMEARSRDPDLVVLLDPSSSPVDARNLLTWPEGSVARRAYWP